MKLPRFPRIEHIDDVLPYIKGRKEFEVTRHEHFTVIDYKGNEPSMFDLPIRRELRGIKFNREGGIIARPLHKTFDLDEHEETKRESIDLSKKHTITYLLDGEMVHPAFVDGHLTFMTRSGTNWISGRVTNFANDSVKNFCWEELQSDYTPIFEWCDPANPKFVKYHSPMLRLLAIRNTVTGEYVTRKNLCESALCYYPQIHVIESWGMANSIDRVVEHVDRPEGTTALMTRLQRGLVIALEDGTMVKIKNKHQEAISKVLESLRYQKDALSVAILHSEDDFLKALPEDKARSLVRYSKAVQHEIVILSRIINNTVESFKYEKRRNNSLERKDLALDWVAHLPEQVRGVAFDLYDGRIPDAETGLKRRLLKMTRSETTAAMASEILSGVSWDNFKVKT